MSTTTNTTRNFLSLAEFRASQKWCDDLVQFGADDGIKGFVYADCCYIEQTGSTPMDAHFQLIIERSEWDSDAIEGLESILWAEHYLFDTADVVLSVDDGTLDDFVRAICDSHRKPCDGDLFGVLFSGKGEWSPEEAHEIITTTFTPPRVAAQPAGPSNFARITADTLDAGACNQIARFLRSSAKQERVGLDPLELRAMVRAADALETILTWQTPKAVKTA